MEMQKTTLGSLVKGYKEGRVQREAVTGVVNDLTVIHPDLEVEVPAGTIAAKEERQSGRGTYGNWGHQMCPEMLAGSRQSTAEINGCRPLMRWELEAGG